MTESYCCGLTIVTPPFPIQPRHTALIPVDTPAAVLWGEEAADSTQLPGALSAPSAAAQQELPWILAYQWLHSAGTHARSHPPCCFLSQVSRSRVSYRRARFPCSELLQADIVQRFKLNRFEQVFYHLLQLINQPQTLKQTLASPFK